MLFLERFIDSKKASTASFGELLALKKKKKNNFLLVIKDYWFLLEGQNKSESTLEEPVQTRPHVSH